MTTLREAAQQALEAICGAKLCEFNSMSSRHEMVRLMDEAITALRAALAEPVQEPVAWRYKPMVGSPWSLSDDGYYISCKRDSGYIIEPLYTAPPQRKPLTDAVLGGIAADIWGSMLIAPQSYKAFARAIERAHGIGEQP